MHPKRTILKNSLLLFGGSRVGLVVGSLPRPFPLSIEIETLVYYQVIVPFDCLLLCHGCIPLKHFLGNFV